MELKKYHHGDLRRALIEAGIRLIGQEGEESLSLRKAAAECGVSNAAPYAHFKNKDEFIFAIQQHIMDLFTASLEETFQEYSGRNGRDSGQLLPMLGKTYVMFFYKNPVYYDFLFSRKNIKINLSLNGSDENMPIGILKKAAVNILGKAGMPQEVIQNKIIAMWALVQGLSAIATMPGVEYDGDWELHIEEVIKSVTVYNREEK